MSRLHLQSYSRAVEQSFDVSKCRFENEDIWPLVKLTLAKVFDNDLVQEGPRVPLMKKWVRLLTTLTRRGAEAIWLCFKAIVFDRENKQKLRKVENLFVTHTTCRVPLNGKWYDIFFDPLVDSQESFVDYISLESIASNDLRQPRYRPSRYRFTVFSSNLFRLPVTIKLLLNTTWIDEISRCEAVTQHGINPKLLARYIRLAIIRYHLALGYWKNALFFTMPNRILIATWYSPENMALCSVASKLNIETVDIQHGVQGPHHWMYSGWNFASPTSTPNLIPKTFWVWRQKEKTDLETWCKKSSRHIDVVGNLWLSKSVDFFSKNGFASTIDKIKVLGPFALYTHQENASEFFPSTLIDFLRKTSQSLLIVMRTHPSRKRELAQIIEIFATHGITNIEWEIGSNAPLSLILQSASIHVTHASSVIIEAGLLGVKSFASSEMCATMYPDEISSGLLELIK